MILCKNEIYAVILYTFNSICSFMLYIMYYSIPISIKSIKDFFLSFFLSISLADNDERQYHLYKYKRKLISPPHIIFSLSTNNILAYICPTPLFYVEINGNIQSVKYPTHGLANQSTKKCQ